MGYVFGLWNHNSDRDGYLHIITSWLHESCTFIYTKPYFHLHKTLETPNKKGWQFKWTLNIMVTNLSLVWWAPNITFSDCKPSIPDVVSWHCFTLDKLSCCIVLWTKIWQNIGMGSNIIREHSKITWGGGEWWRLFFV